LEASSSRAWPDLSRLPGITIAPPSTSRFARTSPATTPERSERQSKRSLRGFALARSRVERHTQCQSFLAGRSFGPLELAGDLGGRSLLPRECFELAYLLRGPFPPFRLLDHPEPPGFAPARSRQFS